VSQARIERLAVILGSAIPPQLPARGRGGAQVLCKRRGGRNVKPTTLITPSSHSENYWRDVWQHRELIGFLAWRDLLVRYKQTVVGIAWTVLKPFTTLLVYTFVFGTIAQLPSGGVPYVLIVLTGLLPWQLFSIVFSVVSESLVANAHLVSKVYFPRMIIPLSAIAVCIVDHLVSFVLIVALLAWYGMVPGLQIVLLPLVTMLAALTALGIGLIAGALNVRYRDLRQVIRSCCSWARSYRRRLCHRYPAAPVATCISAQPCGRHH
jgi:lipopolysaccharide transport system permease protein